MKNLIIYIILGISFGLLLSNWVQAQNQVVRGQIIDEQSKEPIPEVQISVQILLENQTNWNYYTITNLSGNFELPIPDSLSHRQTATLLIQPSEAAFMNLRIPISLATQRPYVIPLNLPKLPEEANLPNDKENKNSTINQASDTPTLDSLIEITDNEDTTSEQNEPNPSNEQPQTINNSTTKPLNPNGNTITIKPLKGVDKLNQSLENISSQLIEEKKFIAERNERISEEIQRMFNELENDKDITPEEKTKFIEKLEALEKLLQENILSYQKLQVNTQAEIDQMRQMILGNNYYLYVYRNVIIYLGLAILGLIAFVWGALYLVKRVKKERNRFQTLSEQKERLLKEIHHRVKNNLQNVNSILNLQSDTLEDRQVLDAIKDIQSRIYSMALIHKVLHQSEEQAYIDIQSYLEKLVSHLASTFNTENRQIHYHIQSVETLLDVDTATNLGLIINELISNAYKYAFVQSNEGNIYLNLFKLENGTFRLEVADDGIGLADGFDLLETRTLGLQLVQCFAEELSGTVQVNSHQGTKFLIHFQEQMVANV